MADVQEEAVRDVSAAVSSADGSLLASIDSAQEKWQQELNTAKNTTREMLADVLSQHECLRSSLSTATQLWGVLKPHNFDIPSSPTTSDSHSTSPNDHFLATDDQMTMVKALQNVSHTIFLVEFILAAPEALERAHTTLAKIQHDGLFEERPGNAALLVEAHSVLTAVERLRDIVLLDAPQTLRASSSPSVCFTRAADTRSLLEDIVIRGVFADVIPVSQSNPRLLVAAARVVVAEEDEDIWWNAHLHRCATTHRGSDVRPYGARCYKERALAAVIDSLQSVFNEKGSDLGLFDNANKNQFSSSSIVQGSCSALQINNILDWIEQRRQESETIRRFVVPCVPPSFTVATLYEKELHRQFMRLVTCLLRLVYVDGSMVLSENDLIQLTSWYSKYKHDIRDHDETIDSFLDNADCRRLIAALQKHCADGINAQVVNALTTDRRVQAPETDISWDQSGETFDDQLHDRKPIRERQGLRRTDLPDVIMGCVTDHAKRMLSLQIRGLDQAIAQTVATCLLSFQSQVRAAVEDECTHSTEEEYGVYICATANNMARCLEYSEDLRDLFIPLASDQNRSDIENKIESVVEGFRVTASTSLLVLINSMTENMRALANRFYAPHTGTEIMLDLVAILEDYFSEYEIHLLPYHFEHLAIESLKRIVVWYLAPFMRLSEQRVEEGAPRRFTSLPTFDETKVPHGEGISEDDVDHDILSRRSANGRGERHPPRGLSSMNAEAVIVQIDKDMSNLGKFMRRKVSLYQKKQLEPSLEPMLAIRSLYTCAPTAVGLSDAFQDARIITMRALRPAWVARCGVAGQLSARTAEVIWESRGDVNPVVLLEAVTMIRTAGDHIESVSPRRISSVDDGRTCILRNHNEFRDWAMSKDTTKIDFGTSSSLMWAPSPSKMRSRKP